jgi:hypothetical protein
MVDWTWDKNKSRNNLAKHGIDFELAQLMFDDPMAATRFEMSYDGEDRWQTIGLIGPVLVLVVHTAPDGENPGRIISARRATRHERRIYEEGDF